jgi:hypothetical protein
VVVLVIYREVRRRNGYGVRAASHVRWAEKRDSNNNDHVYKINRISVENPNGASILATATCGFMS